MKVLGLAGSPRVGGNSDLLLGEVLHGAQEVGADVEKVYLNELKITPCQACDACRQPDADGCVIRDDMQPLYEKLWQADMWVLATPVYWWGPSAQLKLMVDRWYAMMPKKEALTTKHASLIVTMADSDHQTAQPTTYMFHDAFNYLNMTFNEPLVVVAGAKGEVYHNDVEMLRAHTLGKEWFLRYKR